MARGHLRQRLATKARPRCAAPRRAAELRTSQDNKGYKLLASHLEYKESGRRSKACSVSIPSALDRTHLVVKSTQTRVESCRDPFLLHVHHPYPLPWQATLCPFMSTTLSAGAFLRLC